MHRNVSLRQHDHRLSVSMGEIQSVGIAGEKYEGDYEIVPKSTAQTLATKNKRMSKDVTVTAIPYTETSNDNGTTVYIG